MAINLFAMPSSTIVLLLSAAFGLSNALPWAGPEPTAAYKTDEWSPRPTKLPANPADLFKRASVDVAYCGWVGGISSEPAVCPSGSSCIHDTIHKYVGCCATSGPCTAGVYTSCVDYRNTAWNSKPVWQDNGIFTCPGTEKCYLNNYDLGYSAWACGDASDATTVLNSYSGQPSDLKLQTVFTGITFSPSSVSATTTSSSRLSTSTTSTSTSTSSTIGSSLSPTTTAASTSKSSISGGAIAAAVVVPLLVIALLIGGYFFWWRKRQPVKYLERPSSFTGVFKSGSTPDNNPGHFPEMQIAQPPVLPSQQPFSPDDYVSPMTEAVTGSSPLDSSVLSPPGAYAGIQERMNASVQNPYAMPDQAQFSPPNAAGAVSEIEHFSGAYLAAVGALSPMTPAQTPMAFMQSTQPIPNGIAGLTGIAGAREPLLPRPDTTGVATNTNRMRDDSIDAFAALEKETQGYVQRKQSVEPFPLYEVKAFRSGNVRAEGWVPPGLKPNRRAPSSPERYQLIDEAPDVNDGAPVLHEPGQLRKKGR